MPFPEKRLQVLTRVQERVRVAMDRSGFGNCRYYGDAVLRLDYAVWKNQFHAGRSTLPPDWEHDFWQSAGRCLAGR